MLTRLVAVLICALLLPTSAMAQLRPIPDFAKRGHIVQIEGPIVEIDGERMRLSPGAQIRNQNNMIIMPMSVPLGTLVKYTLDGLGEIHRVWVLTPEEAAAPDKTPE
ncbi:MAG TPA: hypothetical protein VMV54_08890 [Acidocella sp.]|nr:hypothetical protein [Acidocella sp.]